jgi:hypothetical protein
MIRVFLLLGVSLAFVAASVFFALNGEFEAGAAVGLFFGGCAFVFAADLVGAGERKAANERRARSLYAEFYLARGRIRLVALGGALMGAGAGLMGAVGAPVWVSWAGAVGGLACFFALASRSFDRSAQLTFDQNSLTWPRLFMAPLPWSAIAAISIEPTGIELHAAPGAPAPKPGLFGKVPKRIIVTEHLLDGDLAALLGALHRFKPNVQVMGLTAEN